jgi:lipopolysaccharide transport system ATP-binding protein
MDFPKAAVIGVIGESSAAPHDYTLDGIDLVSRLRMQAEIEAKRRAGGSVVIRSTDPSLLRSVADEVWWFENGVLRMQGDPHEVLAAYHREVLGGALRDAGKFAEIPVALRRGDGRARLQGVETLNAADQPVGVWQSGEPARIRVTVQFQKEVAEPVVGIMIRTRIGMEVYGTNTELEKLAIGPCAAGDVRIVTFDFNCDLCPQFYTITAASHDPDGVWHDWMEDAVGISVADTRYTAGVANLRARVTCSRG